MPFRVGRRIPFLPKEVIGLLFDNWATWGITRSMVKVTCKCALCECGTEKMSQVLVVIRQSAWRAVSGLAFGSHRNTRGQGLPFPQMCSQFGATSYTSVTVASTFSSPGEIGT